MDNQEKILYPAKEPATITLTILPSKTSTTMPRPKTVLQLLHKLGLRAGMAIVSRNGELLTPDRRIMPNEDILVRKVISEG